MITKYVEFNIICDICDIDGCNCFGVDWLPEDEINSNNFDYLIPVSERGSREVRKNTKEYGWIHKGGKDICPKCQKKG